MEVGSAQSQSLLAAVTTTTQLKASKLTSPEGDTTSVLLSISKQVDTVYAQRVLDDSLAEKFNSAFQEAGMDTTVESLLGGAMDFSPEATANRIVSMAVGFFGSFQANHPEDAPGDQIDGFTELIKGAVEQGFSEARDILEAEARRDLGALPLATRDSARVALKSRLNDACLALGGTYSDDLGPYSALLAQNQGNLRAFIQSVRDVSDQEDPRSALLGL